MVDLRSDITRNLATRLHLASDAIEECQGATDRYLWYLPELFRLASAELVPNSAMEQATYDSLRDQVLQDMLNVASDDPEAFVAVREVAAGIKGGGMSVLEATVTLQLLATTAAAGCLADKKSFWGEYRKRF